ncbi:MAG TPA: hypothetical protein VFL83_09975 [Anaeromyxobacter sp.]|nr:hypothetical protein [Anaeromyxobacter sp.]
MRFHERVYDVAVLLGDPSAPQLWGWPAWQQAARALDPLVAAARGPGAVRSAQYDGKEDVRFGRIGWNAAGHEKWTHGSPRTADASDRWRFLDVELWAPSWTAVERERRPPDVFLHVTSGAHSGRKGPLAFEPIVVLAAAVDVGAGAQAEAAVAALRELCAARLVARSRRPWGLPFGTSGEGYTNGIQDLASTGLFRPGDRHGRPVDVATLAGEWSAG